MNRIEIINKIGKEFYSSNLENGEFSYSKALKSVGKKISDYRNSNSKRNSNYLDIRFENERLAILIETKNSFDKWDKSEIQKQLQEYVKYEKAYSDRKIIAILAETDGDEVWTWHGQSVIIDDEHMSDNLNSILTFEEYEDLYFGNVNDKLKVVDSIKTLNELLHSDGINEKLRSQFVGTCLLALKNGLVYEGVKRKTDNTGKELSPEQVVLNDIKNILEGLLSQGGDLNKVSKLAILNNKVLDDQDVTSLSYQELQSLLSYIDKNVVPYINDKNSWSRLVKPIFYDI